MEDKCDPLERKLQGKGFVAPKFAGQIEFLILNKPSSYLLE
jgi:hypothetical protein